MFTVSYARLSSLLGMKLVRFAAVLLALAPLVALPTTARAQNVEWALPHSSPGKRADSPHAVAVDNQGNVYVTGALYAGDATFAGVVSAQSDAITVKYAPSGVTLWTARYAGPNNADDNPVGVVADDAGNVYITGTSGGKRPPLFSFPDDGDTYEYDVNTFVVKYNTIGKMVWSQQHEGGVYSHSYSAGDEFTAYYSKDAPSGLRLLENDLLAVYGEGDATDELTSINGGYTTGGQRSNCLLYNVGARALTKTLYGPDDDAVGFLDGADGGAGTVALLRRDYATDYDFQSGPSSAVDLRNVATGNTLWTYRLYKGEPYSGRIVFPPLRAPIVNGVQRFLVANAYEAVRLNPQTGAELWKDTSSIGYWRTGAAVAASGSLYLSNDLSVQKLDAVTGAVLWTVNQPGEVRAADALGPIVARIDPQGRLNVTRLSGTNGQVTWTRTRGGGTSEALPLQGIGAVTTDAHFSLYMATTVGTDAASATGADWETLKLTPHTLYPVDGAVGQDGKVRMLWRKRACTHAIVRRTLR